ncbi:hypothetical protein D0B32_07080 [Paraburkholderia sp. DHOC27]|nr:hypothetical protein D0B32_07080 [Paraburkholderia sp. DHOC27]
MVTVSASIDGEHYAGGRHGAGGAADMSKRRGPDGRNEDAEGYWRYVKDWNVLDGVAKRKRD